MILANDGITTLEVYKSDKMMNVMLHSNRDGLKTIDYEELNVRLTKEQVVELIKFLSEEMKWIRE